MIFEVCVDAVEGVQAACQAGAQRVELCSGLVEGGVTPSIGLVSQACRQGIAVQVLVRPRGGDFIYSQAEWEVLRQDIQALKAAGASGVVLGMLRPDGEIDFERTQELVDLARPLSVTFHRAFDLCRDPAAGLETLVRAGIDRLLTSGQRATAIEGAECIAGLVMQAGGRIKVMAGGGINPQNLPLLIQTTGVSEIHFSARKPVASAMNFRRPGVYMGKAYQPDEYNRPAADVSLIRQVMAAGSG